MAASLSSIHREEEFRDEFLTCSICTESYDNANHKAKCLPCLHTFCNSCLGKYVGKKSRFNCPQCRRSVVLAQKGCIEELPSNFMVENLKGYQDIFRSEVACGNCDSSTSAVCFCFDCTLFLCQSCLDGHRKMRSLNQHAVSSMKELQENKCNPILQREERCKKHPKHSLTVYCMEEGCTIPVCPTCALTAHRSHELIEITAAVEKVVQNLHDLSTNVGKRNQFLTDNNESIKTAQKQMTSCFVHKQKEIDEIETTLCQLVKTRCSRAQTHLNELYTAENSLLNDRSKQIESLSAQMTSACKFADGACEMTNPIQLLSSQKQIIQRLTELKTVALPQRQSHGIDFAFSDQHHTAITRYELLLECLCEVNKAFDTQMSQINASKSVAINPDKCTVTLDSNHAAFTECTAVVHTVDADGQAVTIGGARLEARLKVDLLPGKERRSRCRVADNDDGTYAITYVPYWETNHLTVCVNGTAVPGSPFKIWIDGGIE